MAVASPKIKGILYELAVDGTYTATVTTQEFVVSTATSTFNFDFNGITLDEGEKYKIDIYDLFCNNFNSIIVGPVDKALAIDEDQITTVDEVCIGDGGSILIANGAISGGSGSYSYSWTNITDNTTYFTRNVVGASDGTYTLTITDQLRNCTYTIATNVVVLPAGPTIAASWATATNITVNQCADGRLGRLEIVPTGGGGTYSYEWEFTPATASGTISSTIQISNNSGLLIPGSASEIPASMSTTGDYKVYIYDGNISDGCPALEQSISITGPTPVSLTSSLTFSNILCSGDNNGTIEFTVTGGTAPYFYSLNGGTPSTPLSSGANTHLETGLAPGQYNVVIKDSTPDVCTPVTVGQTVTISQPSGGPIELTEGTITEIPCNNGGSGSFVINITGGSNQKVSTGTVSSGSASFTTNNIYQVRVVGPAGNFTLNTSIDSSSETSILIENIPAAGDYLVTVTDGSGFCSQNITITMPLGAAENLAASAQAFDGGGCNSVSDEGGYIQITQFSKGDGEISGYPLWQRLTSGEFDKFNISLVGTPSGAIDLTSIGVVIGGVDTINASGASSSATLAEIRAQLTDNINILPNYTATLNGSNISVVGQIIDSVAEIGSTSSTINVSVSSISKINQSSWSNIPGVEGQEKIENLQSGTYRGIIKDGSGCGSALVQNVDGGTTFRINDPKTLEIKDFNLVKATCKNPQSSVEFRLSNGAFFLSPDVNAYDLTLNSTALVNNGPVGTAYTINPSKNIYQIDNLAVNNYELTVFDKTTSCTTNISFTVEEPISINYSGETNFVIDPCYESFQEDFFDPLLIEGGTPFINLDGDSYYSLTWRYYPLDTSLGVTTINSLSNSVNFNPGPGRYELYVKDSNGCIIIDSNGVEVPIDFIFSKELGSIVINGTGGNSGDELSQPVSCQINAEDGQINIEVQSGDPNNPEIGPYNLEWHIQAPNDVAFEQKLLIEGTLAGDSLEVYTVRLNDIPFSYTTQVQNEPKESVKNELINVIDQSAQFIATESPSNPFEIILTTESFASLDLEIVSGSTKLNLIKTTSNNASWIPLDGTNGYADYTGFLDLNNLAEGLYRYTITSASVAVCANNAAPNSVQGTIVVENENILEIREGPVIDEYLCNGQPGTIFIDVFDGNTGPLTFRYNGSPVTFEVVGTNQYIVNIDNPVDTASLEIYNSANCGLSREINIGNGTPLFDFTSTNFVQSGSFLAREDVTFSDISENEYDSFEFIFGDGTQTELLERNSPEPITHEYAISGTYYVTLRIYNDLGCVEELTKTIKIGKGYSLLVPNVFTPNGDIWNNTFRPVFNGFSEITLRIYDAQGGLLYEEQGAVGSDPNIVGLSLRGWEGEVNLPSSPYFIYTITAKTIDDEPVFRDGTFIILK
ncbi:gliding motility-associated C-terminal domain-containing protein [Flavobacteriaceae bacterium]|nr:gliding motility-associated C-terminal domain-containing protein [Flavobacteriaceae bacterium]